MRADRPCRMAYGRVEFSDRNQTFCLRELREFCILCMFPKLTTSQTLPPTVVAMIIIGLWSWTNIEIQRMQPYIDLAHGNAKSETTLLLDYTRTKYVHLSTFIWSMKLMFISTFLIWMQAASNGHWIVTMASIIALAGLAFQPLAAGWLTVRNIWLPLPPTSVRNLKDIGLSPDFSTLVPYVLFISYSVRI